MKLTVVVLMSALAVSQAICPNSCSGHGSCNTQDKCTCYSEGKRSYFGAEFDPVAGNAYSTDASQFAANPAYTGADCSLRTCPRGMSFSSISSNSHQDNVECSDRGTGTCECVAGWEGAACQKSSCPNGCSGHGTCQSNINFAHDAGRRYLNAWDSGLQLGCKCDGGYRGVDCSMKECPSASDPLNYEGNESGRDCSGRGICDYEKGICQCFSGYTGVSCEGVQALA